MGSPQKWQRGCKCKGKLGTAGHGTKHTKWLKHRITESSRLEETSKITQPNLKWRSNHTQMPPFVRVVFMNKVHGGWN